MITLSSRLKQIDTLAAVLVAIIAVHVWLLTAADLKVVVWPDSINTIGPALDKLEHGILTYWPTIGSFVYPLFVWFVLSIAPEPQAVVLAQRALLVTTSVSLAFAAWLTLRQVRRLVTMPRWVECAIAGAWLLTFVIDLPTIGLAHALMPETLFGTLLGAWLVAIVVLSLNVAGSARALAAGAVGMSTVALFSVKPHWLLAAVILVGLLAATH